MLLAGVGDSDGEMVGFPYNSVIKRFLRPRDLDRISYPPDENEESSPVVNLLITQL